VAARLRRRWCGRLSGFRRRRRGAARRQLCGLRYDRGTRHVRRRFGLRSRRAPRGSLGGAVPLGVAWKRRTNDQHCLRLAIPAVCISSRSSPTLICRHATRPAIGSGNWSGCAYVTRTGRDPASVRDKRSGPFAIRMPLGRQSWPAVRIDRVTLPVDGSWFPCWTT